MARESMVIAAVAMRDPNSSSVGSSFGWFDSPRVSTSELNRTFPLKEGVAREMSYNARVAVADRLSPLLAPEKREAFVASMGMAETADGVINVLAEHEVLQKLNTQVKEKFGATELTPKTAKLIGTTLSRFACKDERKLFKNEVGQAKTIGEAATVIQKYDIDTGVKVRANQFLKLGAVAAPLLIVLSSCFEVPNIDPMGQTQPDVFHEFFNQFPNDAILKTAGWGGVIGAGISIIENVASYIKSVTNATPEKPPRAIHSAAMNAVVQGGLEGFENCVKAGSAMTGLAVFGGGVPVESVRTLGGTLSIALFVQTFLEFLTEGPNRIGRL